MWRTLQRWHWAPGSPSRISQRVLYFLQERQACAAFARLAGGGRGLPARFEPRRGSEGGLVSMDEAEAEEEEEEEEG